MRAAVLNRATIALGFLGLFVAGLLSMEKISGAQLPCGPGGGCAAVSNDPSGYWFNIPVAFFGFVGYLMLTGLAVVRASQTRREMDGAIKIGLAVSGFGALASLWLQYQALVVLKSFCPWCVASAVTMLLTFGLHVALFRTPVDETEPRPQGRFIATSALVAILGLTVASATMGRGDGNRTAILRDDLVASTELVPARANIYGDPKAKITIVEFADLCCSMCQVMSPKVKEFVSKSNGKVRLVFRHFPLPMHQFGQTAAAMAEYAADKGRFWEFAGYFVQGEEPKSLDVLQAAAQAAGLDTDDMVKRLGNDNDPAYGRVQRDKRAADALGLNSTPTFIVLAPGKPAKLAKGQALFEVLQSEEYQEAIKSS